MLVTKTVKVPVHYATTKSCTLERLTARLTYGVKLWSGIIEEHGIKRRKEFKLEYQHFVQERTRLSAGFVQQCADATLWMWESYRELGGRERSSGQRRGRPEALQKLLKREPSKPFHNEKNKKKIPTRFDCRTRRVERSEEAKLSPWVIRISTLEKHEPAVIFLNPVEYHLKLLERGEIRDLKHGRKYYAHVVVQYEVRTSPSWRSGELTSASGGARQPCCCAPIDP